MKRTKLMIAASLLAGIMAMQAKKVHTLGDSTMAPYDEQTEQKRGWGMYFGNFLTGGWTSVNYAKGGRDSRGGYNELWQNAKKNVQEGDYVLIQFAHNDEKYNGMDNLELQAYYNSVGNTAGASSVKTDGRGTVPSTTYKECLKQIIDEVKAKGATPVLVAPVCRCYFSGEKITRTGRHDLGDKFSVITADGIKENQKVAADNHQMDYVYHMAQLAEETGVAFVDLTTATRQLYESYGSAKCHDALFCEGDNTHYNTTGALLAARLCAQLMKQQHLLHDDIVVPVDLSVSPAVADLGDGYKGQTAVKELTLNGFGLSPDNGTIGLQATNGIELSLDKQTWAGQLTVDYQNGTLVKNFFARVALTDKGLFAGTITATLGEKRIDVPLSVNVIELGGQPFSIAWPLHTSDEASTQGRATAGNVVLQGLVKYANYSGKGIMVCPGERAEAAQSGTWVAAEDDSPNQYVQFSVEAPEGTTLDIDHIGLKVGAQGGGGMRCHVYYSTDGFSSRTAIYAPAAMTSGEMNEVEASPVVKLEEGQTLQVRVYPWYNANADGKWLCVSDVVIGGQWTDAGGINIDGTVVFPLNKGGLMQGDDAVMTPTEMTAGFSEKTWTAGNDIEVEGVIKYVGQNSETTTMSKIYNPGSGKLQATPVDGNTMTLTLRPAEGFNFMPKRIGFKGARFGTDSGTLTVVATTGDKQETLCQNAPVNRGGKELDISTFAYELTSLMASHQQPLLIAFSFLTLGSTKSMGLSDLVIDGMLVGGSGTSSGMQRIEVTPQPTAGTAGDDIFTLDGRRVATLKRGLNVKKGKKIVF